MALACAILIGFSKAGIAGAGILTIPLMAAMFPPGKSTGIMLPILIVGDVFALAVYRRHAAWRPVLDAVAWGFVGVFGGWAMARYAMDGWGTAAADGVFRRVIGGIVVGMVVLGIWLRLRRARMEAAGEEAMRLGRWFAVLVGLVGGVATMLANAAGPVWIIYLLTLRLPKAAFLGTMAWLTLTLNCVKVPFSLNLGFMDVVTLKFNLAMVPGVVLGGIVGIRVARWIPQSAFNRIVEVLAVVAALWLLRP